MYKLVPLGAFWRSKKVQTTPTDLLGARFKISDEHPRLLNIDAPTTPRPPTLGNCGLFVAIS